MKYLHANSNFCVFSPGISIHFIALGLGEPVQLGIWLTPLNGFMGHMTIQAMCWSASIHHRLTILCLCCGPVLAEY